MDFVDATKCMHCLIFQNLVELYWLLQFQNLMDFLDFVWNSRDKYTLGNGYDKIFEKISWWNSYNSLGGQTLGGLRWQIDLFY